MRIPWLWVASVILAGAAVSVLGCWALVLVLA